MSSRCPAYVDHGRWRQCIDDARRFLPEWSEQAAALGWTVPDLFGLHDPPANPRPNYRRLSRYDATGLLWLLQGAPVAVLTQATAAIQNLSTGNTLTYRKPALGPLGDSLDDFK